MKRLALSLLLLAGACAAPPASRPSGPQSAADSNALALCRQDAERMMRYRERGQTMRVDEAESRTGTGAFIGNRVERDQLGARFEQDRLVDECLRSRQPASAPAVAPSAAPPGGSGRGS